MIKFDSTSSHSETPMLMDQLTIENLPDIRIHFVFTNEKGKRELIENIARRVSNIFGAFLTEEVRLSEWIKDKIRLEGQPKKFPSEERVADFKLKLQAFVKKKLLKMDSSHYSRMTLSIDYGPDRKLQRLLDAAGIKCEGELHKSYPYFFPYKFVMVINNSDNNYSPGNHFSVASWQNSF